MAASFEGSPQMHFAFAPIWWSGPVFPPYLQDALQANDEFFSPFEIAEKPRDWHTVLNKNLTV